MDWYIYLTPFLLLPIIFLFRLIGCDLPNEGSKPPAKKVFFQWNAIPAKAVNPIESIHVSIQINGSEVSLNGQPPKVLSGNTLPPGFVSGEDDNFGTEDSVQVECYVFLRQYGIDTYDFPVGSIITELSLKTSAVTLNFELVYSNTNATQYVKSDFALNFG